jgi:hypothetical protein
VRRGVLALAVAALGFTAGPAWAGPCGLPDAQPLWVDFGTPTLAHVFGRPGVIVSASTGDFPAAMRSAGAKTVYWDMNLRNRVGAPDAPADPGTIEDRAARLASFAAAQTACATPWIALNELQGASLPTPWSATNAQYRANVLAFLRALAARGARPFLLVSSAPFTRTPEAAAWWRDVALVSDVVQEVYTGAPLLWRQGPIRANRRLRMFFRRSVGAYTAIGIPSARVGLMLGFQTRLGYGGREGLRPRNAWLETVKWQGLSARQVAREMRIATVWSWGWGTWGPESADADKERAACVYLWTRNPRLCDVVDAVDPGFDFSRSEGQLIVPGGAQCKVGRNTISTVAIARLRRLTGDRDVAYSALFARLVEARVARVSRKRILAAERTVIALRFGGSVAGYRAALAQAGAGVDVARAILGDSIRRAEIESTLYVRPPAAREIASFYLAFPELLARPVRVTPAPWWLGGRKVGIALSSLAPERVFKAKTGRTVVVRALDGTYSVRTLGDPMPLGALPLERARPAISAALRAFARGEAFERWTARRQTAMLAETTCRRDDMPAPGPVDLSTFLPFLSLTGA